MCHRQLTENPRAGVFWNRFFSLSRRVWVCSQCWEEGYFMVVFVENLYSMNVDFLNVNLITFKDFMICRTFKRGQNNNQKYSWNICKWGVTRIGLSWPVLCLAEQSCFCSFTQEEVNSWFSGSVFLFFFFHIEIPYYSGHLANVSVDLLATVQAEYFSN